MFRPEATRELIPALHAIEEYLQHHALVAIQGRTAADNASLYPHLGQLLTICVRHPVILASRTRVDLVLSAVIAYSNQQERYQHGNHLRTADAKGDYGDENMLLSSRIGFDRLSTSGANQMMPSPKDSLPPEAVWCAQRIKDAIQIGHRHYDGPQQPSTISTGTIESKPLVDQCVKHFALDRRAYNEALADEIIRSANIVLTTMEKRLSIEQSDGDLKAMPMG
ncbi:hypothetical protein BGW41_001183 [Actinomortierella wolfii]|nr:hypothetical protein BGW41_001183 [Actinomortierella wolfii]